MEHIYKTKFIIEAGNFVNAGKASRNIKNLLSQFGIDQKIIRKIAVCSYEAEMNQIIHSYGGIIYVQLETKKVKITAIDSGPGIADITLAMTEGYSTATQEIRSLGFGAGMGLPNMKLCADEFFISSSLKDGTNVKMTFEI